ncbi:ABC transporter substrate-binding protein [Paenibacillus thalictri]|uniref:ABC transporter substrate-binding protein n=1 Tax=Paenibacillus thalictri TaxID=2527873 RepID=A0A4Q9DJH0_9BACL|nr:ABC transporter substrate-binding protein [Paenibacillus thalictri]TBL72484.1 ABC transporter substrate-binding protein [Paenibacillus thalictri]
MKSNRFHLAVLSAVLVLPACSGGGGTAPAATGSAPAASGAAPAAQSASKGPVTIEFARGTDTSGEVVKSIERFNKSHTDIQVKYVELPSVPNEQLTRYTTWFNSKSKTPDLLLMDVTWPKMFASAGWIAPIDEYVNADYLKQFYPAAVDVAKIDGKQYGIQGWMDVGMLYYRKDLLDKYNQKVPTTWSELEKVASEILKQEKDPNLTGYVFQGAKIEGATINWLEYLWGAGGDVFDASKKIKVDTPQGTTAMKQMHSLVHQSKVSPVSVATSNPNDNQIVFGNGNSIFMRAWPNAYAGLKETKAAGKYDVTSMPKFEGGESHGSTGGWVYAINSSSEHKKEAAEVMKFFMSDAEQKSLLLNAGSIPTNRKALTDPEVISKEPVIQKIQAFMENAKSRPALRAYEQFSRAMQTEINLVLNGQKDPEQAIKDAQKEIDKIKE